ncbi:MAG: hypothetical protein KDC34_08605 [Saprospiraceae bacterium]|nr:hypothetical protein [Saprospiraceae bacterium]
MIIHKLILQSANIKRLREFYTTILELPLLSESTDHICLQVGQSQLEFRYNPDALPYHFAFNTPPNLVEETHQWLRKRVALLLYEGNERIEFSSWQASAFYFYDPDGNIVEFIARRPLQAALPAPFSAEKILRISEIGAPVDSIEATFKKLHADTGVTQFSGNFELFFTAGDPEGLFILIDKNKRLWFPNGDPAPAAPFILQAEIDGTVYLLKFEAGVFSRIAETDL